MSARLRGGITRDISGHSDAPLRFTLTIDRGLKSGKLDIVELTEADLLRLIVDAAKALQTLRGRG